MYLVTVRKHNKTYVMTMCNRSSKNDITFYCTRNNYGFEEKKNRQIV